MYAGTLQDDEEWQRLKAAKDDVEHRIYKSQSHIASLIEDIALNQARIEALRENLAAAMLAQDNIKRDIMRESQIQSANRDAFRLAAAQLYQREIAAFDEFNWILIETIGSNDEPHDAIGGESPTNCDATCDVSPADRDEPHQYTFANSDATI